MAHREVVLFLTNSEHGQANVMLAVAHELLARDEFDLHIGSFPCLHPRVTQLQSSFSEKIDPITFHPLPGLSMFEAYKRKTGKVDTVHAPGLSGAVESYRLIPNILAAWDGPEYVKQYDACLELIGTLHPTVVVVDPLFSQGIDACKKVAQKYILLSPVSLNETIKSVQTGWVSWWKYPIVSSGYPFPLPWYYIPLNIYLFIRIIFTFVFAEQLWMHGHYRRKHEIPSPNQMPCLGGYFKDALYISPALPEIDLPFVIPPNVTTCGPILSPMRPISQIDPELANWLKRGPTIVISLGTHAMSEASDVQELASGLKIAMSQRSDLQVLWKLTSQSKEGLLSVLDKELASGRVLIKDWLTADPLAILQSGHIVCFVHHGGANSFYEALWAGVPQVVLPMWFDTYDFANRVEWLGVGIYGSSGVAPHVKGSQFGQALSALTGAKSQRAISFRERAVELSKICQKAQGRKAACDKIIEVVRNEKQ